MTDTWAAKVLEGVDKYTDIHTTDDLPVVFLDEVIAAIAKLADGDGLVERATAALEGVTEGPWSVPGQPDKICTEGYTRNGMAKTIATIASPAWMGHAEPWANACFIAFARQWVPEAAAHIAALTAQNREMALDVLASSGQAQEAYAAQIAAEAEAAALREQVARLEGALRGLHHAVCGETGFAACVRLDSGNAYPWPALDAADDAARAILRALDDQREGGRDG